MRLWKWIKSALVVIWELIKWLVGKIWKPLALLIILFAVWFAFLKLVSPPPLYTTPALIMVWASAAVLILALYPNILERIKSLKIGDFEIELQEVVQEVTTNEFTSISASDFDDDLLFTQKGDLRNLQSILSRSIREPNKPVLLVVNISGDMGEGRISIPMLFVYLFFIDVFSKSSVVLFISSRRRSKKSRTLSETKVNEVVGAMSGNDVLRRFYQQFPDLILLWSQQGFARNNISQNNIFENDGFQRIPSRRFLRDMYEQARNLISGDNDEAEHLTGSKVRDWFGGNLSTRTLNKVLDNADLESIRQALLQGDEYLLIVQGNNLQSIVITCSLTTNLSKKMIDYLLKAK